MPTDMRVQLAMSVFESNKLLREEFLDGAEFEVRRFSEQVFLSDELFVEIVQGCGFLSKAKEYCDRSDLLDYICKPSKT